MVYTCIGDVDRTAFLWPSGFSFKKSKRCLIGFGQCGGDGSLVSPSWCFSSMKLYCHLSQLDSLITCLMLVPRPNYNSYWLSYSSPKPIRCQVVSSSLQIRAILQADKGHIGFMWLVLLFLYKDWWEPMSPFSHSIYAE